MDDCRSFWQHRISSNDHPPVISERNNSQLSCKISDFGHPLSTGNGLLYCKEIHPLLLGCFITFLTCIEGITGDPDSINEHLMSNTMSLLQKMSLNYHAKYRIMGTLSAQRMDWCTVKEIHPLLLECFITFLRCIKGITDDSDSIYKHLIANTMSFLSKTTLKFHAKYQILGTRSAWDMGCCSAKRDIQCWWSVSSPSSDV